MRASTEWPRGSTARRWRSTTSSRSNSGGSNDIANLFPRRRQGRLAGYPREGQAGEQAPRPWSATGEMTLARRRSRDRRRLAGALQEGLRGAAAGLSGSRCDSVVGASGHSRNGSWAMELETYVWITTRTLKPGTREEFSRAWRPGPLPGRDAALVRALFRGRKRGGRNLGLGLARVARPVSPLRRRVTTPAGDGAVRRARELGLLHGTRAGIPKAEPSGPAA